MRPGTAILLIVLVLLFAWLGLTLLKVAAIVFLVIAILALLVVGGVGLLMWSLKRKVRRELGKLQSQLQERLRQRQGGTTPPVGGAVRPEVIDVQPTSVQDEHQ